LARLGVRQAFVVCSHDGLDEVSLSAPTSVRHVRGDQVIPLEWTAADFGLEPTAIEELRVEGVPESAEVLRVLLAGQDGPPRRVVLANAAAALLAAEQVSSLKEGVNRAAAAIDTGKANRVLQRLRQSD
jgi:anthranilate phosphoribosyltransferase